MTFTDLPYEDKVRVLEAVKRRPLKRAWKPKKELLPVLKDIGCEFYRSGKNAGCARAIPLFLLDQVQNWLELEQETYLQL